MVQDVAEVEGDLVVCGDGEMFVAMPGKALDNIDFAIQEASDSDDLPAAPVDLLEDRTDVVCAR